MTCHPEVHDAACAQFNNDEYEERMEQDVAGPDLTGVVVDACPGPFGCPGKVRQV